MQILPVVLCDGWRAAQDFCYKRTYFSSPFWHARKLRGKQGQIFLGLRLMLGLIDGQEHPALRALNLLPCTLPARMSIYICAHDSCVPT